MPCLPSARMAAAGCPHWGCVGNLISKRLAVSGTSFIPADTLLHAADEPGGGVGARTLGCHLAAPWASAVMPQQRESGPGPGNQTASPETLTPRGREV